jgi:hypothetical protein
MSTVRSFRIYDHVVRPIAAVELRVAWHRRFAVALTLAGIPPAAHFDRF